MFDEIALEKFALQVIINAQRISSLKNQDVDRAVFDIHRYLYLQYYNGIDTKNKWAKYLLNNLRHNDFIGYRKYISLA
jgi:transcriptional regulator NrdR family protein